MTFTDGNLTLIPGYFALLPAIPIAVWILRRRADRRWTVLALLALIHVDLVIALTIFPIPIAGQEFYRQTRGLSEDNLVPFATIWSQIQELNPRVDHNGAILVLSAARQLFGNAVALVPLGIYGPGLWPALRRWRRFVLVAVGFGVGIELTQFAGSVLEGFTYRVTDVDDAIMNASGAIAAFFAWRWVETTGALRPWLERWSISTADPAAR